MPTTPFPQDGRFVRDELRLAIDEATGGNITTQEPDRPGIIDTAVATFRTRNPAFFLGAAGARAFGDGGDTGFDPIAYIRSNSALSSDPDILEMVDRGQFDDVNDTEDFAFQMGVGYRLLRDQRTLTDAGVVTNIIGGLSAELLNPLNLVAGGIGTGAVRAAGASIASRAGAAAVAGGAANLAIEEVTNRFNPYSELDGVSNELNALFAGAVFGAALDGALAPVARRAFQGTADAVNAGVRSGRLNDLRRQAQKVLYGLGAASDATTGRGDFRYEVDLAHDSTVQTLRGMLDGELPDHATVTVLTRPGEESERLLKELRQRYRDEDKVLNVERHPEQDLDDAIRTLQELEAADELNPSGVASGGELGFGPVGTAISGAAQAVTESVARVASPSARLVTSSSERLGRFGRVMVGGESTIARGAALDPDNYVTTMPADIFRERFRLQMYQSAVRLKREAWRDAKQRLRKGEMLPYDGGQITNEQDWRNALSDYLQRTRDAATEGSGVGVPTDVDPSLVKAGEIIRGAFKDRLAELDDAGILIGPQRFAEIEAEQQAAIGAARARLADAEARANAEGATPEQIDRANRTKATAQKDMAKAEETLALAKRRLAQADAYWPTVFNVRRIIADEQNFVNTVSRGLMRSFLRDGDAATIIPEVAERFPGVDFESMRLVRDLTPDLRAAYDEALQGYADRIARSVADNFTGRGGRHAEVTGVLDAFANTDPTVGRVLDVNRSDLIQFLENDPFRVMDYYQASVGGRYGVARAIALDPVLSEATVNGRRVRTADDLLDWLTEDFQVRERIAAELDRVNGVAERELGPQTQKVRRAHENAIRNARTIAYRVIGKNTRPGTMTNEGFDFAVRTMLRMSHLSKLGGVALAQLPEFASPIMYAMSPRGWRSLGTAVRAVALNGRDRNTLHSLNYALNLHNKADLLGDIDFQAPYRGFGTNGVRRASSAIEGGLEATTRVFNVATLMDSVTTLQYRLATAVSMHETMDIAFRVARNANVSTRDRALLNANGLNRQGVDWLMDKLYQYGRTPDGKRYLRDLYASKDEMLASGRTRFADLNLTEWELNTRADRDAYDRFTVGASRRASRDIVVTPGAGDKPIFSESALGKVFNQFWNFIYAFTNQRMRNLAQQGTLPAFQFIIASIGLAGLGDAVRSALGGRRSIEESAREWEENPLGMLYVSTHQSGVLGWLSRPIGVWDLNAPDTSPAAMVGAPGFSAATRGYRPGLELSAFGPVASDIQRAFSISMDVLGGEADQNTAKNAWRLLPFQNLVYLRMLWRAAGWPVVPEALD